MKRGITVVVPTIPPRAEMLSRAVDSVTNATASLTAMFGDLAPVSLVTVVDERREGAACTRQRGLLEVETEFVAFLDDDDVMHGNHLLELYGAMLEHGADYAWSRFQIIKHEYVWVPCTDRPCPHAGEWHHDDRPHMAHPSTQVWCHLAPRVSTIQGPVFLGEKAFSQWDDADPCQTTIVTMVKTQLALDAGGFAQFNDDGSTVDGNRRGEDHEFTLACRKAGGVFRHVPRVTWDWHHHTANTSGMPTW